jgi:hypothetical protein
LRCPPLPLRLVAPSPLGCSRSARGASPVPSAPVLWPLSGEPVAGAPRSPPLAAPPRGGECLAPIGPLSPWLVTVAGVRAPLVGAGRPVRCLCSCSRLCARAAPSGSMLMLVALALRRLSPSGLAAGPLSRRLALIVGRSASRLAVRMRCSRPPSAPLAHGPFVVLANAPLLRDHVVVSGHHASSGSVVRGGWACAHPFGLHEVVYGRRRHDAR